MFGHRNGGGVDGEVLAELRAIREEIHALSERVADAATREDLKGYVTQQQFDDHIAGEDGKVLGWRWWATMGMSSAAILLSLISSHVGLVLR
ncbi:MAG TPA: hypothetical protein VE338_19165 [Ktedonobacterales bacterium]|jgi:hypothetical protein|nr:hypothetical protein [Ktedonobacterales bacterium]